VSEAAAARDPAPARRGPGAWPALLPLAALAVALLAGGPTRSPLAGAELAAAADRVDGERLHAWLAELQERYPKRTPGRAAHAEAPGWIAEALRAAGAADVRIAQVRGQRNVHARIPGRDGSRAVVLAAHHDVVAGAPGAVDDGGAVACLVEAARVLAAREDPPAVDVELVVFDGEERGLLGSKAHVEALGPAGRERVAAAIAVELVGWDEDALVVHTIPSGFAWDAPGVPPAWLPAGVVAAAADAGVPVGVGDPWVSPWYQASVRVLGVQTGSDAGAYLEREVPAVMLTGSSLLNFYDAYHTPRDGLHQVDPARLADAARVLVAAALELAARAPAGPRDLGRPYVVLFGRVLDRWGLLAVGLLAAAVLAWAGLAGSSDLARPARAVLATTAALVAAAAAAGSVLGLLLGVPCAVGLAAAARLARGRPLVLYAAYAVPLAEGLLFGAAVGSFGFRWRAGGLETALVLALAAALVAAGPLVRRRPQGGAKLEAGGDAR